MVRTEVPGVYRRGGRFVAVYRDAAGRQHKRFAGTLGEAASIKDEETGRVAADRTEIRRRKDARAVRAGVDIRTAYSELRRTLLVVDNAYSAARGQPRVTISRVLTNLHAAEDEMVLAMRELSIQERP